MTAFLSLRGLTKRYGGFTAVSDLTLDVPQGKLVALLGPSGCGKTTTLRMIAGLVPASAGHILVGGDDLTRVPPYRRDMGVVFQSYALFPHLSVAANIAFGLKMRKIGRAEREARVRAAIGLVHLEGREDRKPAQLSGGQQQRVALARALVVQPRILLLDEPLSNLDAKLRDEMRREIRDIQQRLGITAIFVTHDQSEALTMCDRVVVMNHGRLEQEGTPHDLYEQPATPFVAAFVGRTNRLAAVAHDGAATLGDARLALAGHHAGPIELMIRPHRIRITDPTTVLPPDAPRIDGIVARTIYAGDVLQYEVQVGPHLLLVERSTVTDDAIVAPGTSVILTWHARDMIVFAAAS